MSKRDSKVKKTDAFVRILEQPAPEASRFRYKSEGSSARSIPGVNSTTEYKTYPSIQVVGFQGKAMVVVSCVTKDYPYKPHPHHLVGQEGCKRGICALKIPKETMSIQFPNLGIQCVKKTEIEASLNVREEQNIDPFRTGFNHKKDRCSIDLNTLRLCFQVIIEGETKGQYSIPLPPVVSDPIHNKKPQKITELKIIKLSHYVRYVDDNKEITLLCEKVLKDNIKIRFYEETNGVLVWEGFGHFEPSQVHKQCAITFRAPSYHNLDVQDPVKVWIQLKRPSDGATGEALPFEFFPSPDRRRKRPKFDSHDNIWNDPEFAQMLGRPKAETNPAVWNITPQIPAMMMDSTFPFDNLGPLVNVSPDGCLQPTPVQNINTNADLCQEFLPQVYINSEELRLLEQDLMEI